MLVNAAGRAYRVEMDRRTGQERRKSRDGEGRRKDDPERDHVRDEVALSEAAKAYLAASRAAEDGIK